MRKIFTPAFSDRALKQQEPLFVRYTDQLVSKLKEGTQTAPDREWDMVRMYNFTTFDVMGDLTFGEPLHMLDSAEYVRLHGQTARSMGTNLVLPSLQDPWVKIIFSSIKFSSRIST